MQRAGLDPLSVCRNTELDTEGMAIAKELPNSQTRVSSSVGQENDVMFQLALMQSIADQDADDPELQQVLMQSCKDKGGATDEEDTSGGAPLLSALLTALGLQRMDVGSTNISEGGNILNNQCFYLAIARSWLANAAKGGGLLVRDSALQLKREVETSVLQIRGEAARQYVGDEKEAYTDYLACALRSGGSFADLAIVVFASLSGTIEVYEGGTYARLPREQRVANLALIWHRRSHFEAVVANDGGKADMTLEDVLQHADGAGVNVTTVKE